MARQYEWRQRVAALRANAQAALHGRFMSKRSFEPASVPDREATIAALRTGDLELEHAPAELRADRDVVLTAMWRRGSSFKHASAELRADPEFVMAAARTHVSAFALNCTSYALRTDRDFVQTAKSQFEKIFETSCWKELAVLVFLAFELVNSHWAKHSLRRDRDALGAAVGAQTLPAPHMALDAAPEALAIVYALIAQRVEIIEANYAAAQRAYDAFWAGISRTTHKFCVDHGISHPLLGRAHTSG